jgi:hypothetical protein
MIKQKVTTLIILGLSGGKVYGKVVLMDHVDVKVLEVFMPNIMIPFCMLTIIPCQFIIIGPQ